MTGAVSERGRLGGGEPHHIECRPGGSVEVAVGVSAVSFRVAAAADADSVAALHADSWRRHYRGAYADAFLDGDVLADRRTIWSRLLAAPGSDRITIVADQDGCQAG